MILKSLPEALCRSSLWTLLLFQAIEDTCRSGIAHHDLFVSCILIVPYSCKESRPWVFILPPNTLLSPSLRRVTQLATSAWEMPWWRPPKSSPSYFRSSLARFASTSFSNFYSIFIIFYFYSRLISAFRVCVLRATRFAFCDAVTGRTLILFWLLTLSICCCYWGDIIEVDWSYIKILLSFKGAPSISMRVSDFMPGNSSRILSGLTRKGRPCESNAYVPAASFFQ